MDSELDTGASVTIIPNHVWAGVLAWNSSFSAQDKSHPRSSRAAECNTTEIFLGLVNYYRKFIPNMSILVHPLNHLLMFDAPWTEACQVAFKKLKELLRNSPLVAHYDPNKPARMAVDASSYGLGAVLSYVSDDGEEKPIAYTSRSLSAIDQNYSMIETEPLAIVFCIKKIPSVFVWKRFFIAFGSRTSYFIAWS